MRLLPVLVAAAVPLACGPAATSRDAPPNIVFVLADDLGWKDVGYAGSAYPTPNIDRLASLGMVFTQAYAASPACSPTRAAILTGRSPARLHITKAIRNRDYIESSERPGSRAGPSGESKAFLPFEETTFAACLQEAGYETAFFGKWHLGLPPYMPDRYGFATCKGVGPFSASPYFPPYQVKDLEPAGPDDYLTDRLTDEAVAFLRQEHESPFLLYLSHFAVHAPHQAKPALLRRLRRELDHDDPQHDPVYAGMIASLDESVGRLLDALEEGGLLEQTLFVFTSDNGPEVLGDDPVTTTAPLRGSKLDLYEGGIRVPLVVAWPGTIAPSSTCDVPVTSTDFHPTFLHLAGLEPLPGVALDGVDVTSLLRGGDPPPRPALTFHFPHRDPCSAIREGDEKLIHFYSGRDELYDLASDPGETTDLAPARPDRVRRLRADLLARLEEVGAVIPAEDPAYEARDG